MKITKIKYFVVGMIVMFFMEEFLNVYTIQEFGTTFNGVYKCELKKSE